MAFYNNRKLTLTHAFTWFFMGLVVLLFSDCTPIKNYPKNVPFVYNNKINLKSTGITAENKKIIEDKLKLYIDDSLQTPSRQILGFTQRINPPVFDSVNVSRSITFMKSYLQSIGYYGVSFDTFTVKIDTIQTVQLRTTTTFTIALGKNLRIDTTIYKFPQAYLQFLADSSAKNSALLRDKPYSKEGVNQELERLSTLFRNRGYLKMNKSALRAHVDTTDPSLVSTDFLDIGEQIIRAQKRKDDPRINIDIEPQPGTDSAVFLQYYIDSVFIYPEVKVSEEIEKLMYDSTLKTNAGTRQVFIRYREGLFKPQLIRRKNYLLPGSLYNEGYYFRTVNNFYKLGPWQQVEVKTVTRLTDSLAKATFHLFLTPYKKQYFQFDLEGSQNNNISTGNVLSGRFAAAAINITHRNRNFMHRGTQTATIGRAGVELNLGKNNGSRTIQSFIATLNQSFSIPRLYWPFGFMEKRSLDAYRTNINLSASFTDRFELYKQTSFGAGPQWELRKGKNSHTWTIPSFEAVKIKTEPKLDEELIKNPALAYAFTPGNILSARYAFDHSITYKNLPNQTGFYRLGTEATLPGSYKLFGEKFFQFIRFDAQYIHNINKYRHSFNFRAYGAIGWDLGSNSLGTLPFFRQYVAGGSNSMRAWGLRQLGLGNSISSDTAEFTDRFGDIQLEFNGEYRFRMFRFLGYNIDGVAFVDIGNIWNHHPAPDGNGDFKFKYLYRDLGANIGTGIRWDISYVVIRLDLGFKIKDPKRAGAGWIDTFEWKSVNRLGLNERSNFGLQFGIGYPF